MIIPKLIVTDLDGTALTNDKEITKETMQAFEKCRQNGIHIAIATARYIVGASYYAKKLNADFQILTDGTLVYENGKLIYSRTMTKEMTNNIINELKAYGYTSHIAIPTTTALYRYPNKESICSANNNLDTNICNPAYYQNSATSTENSSWNTSDNNIKCDHSPGISFDIDKPFPEEACKIVAHISDDENAKKIADKCDCAYFHYRGETTYTFFHKKASKLDAIKHLAAYLGISLNDICTFGDDINDIEMIEHCGCGVAMANALDVVKERADIVTLSNEENGVAKILENFF